PCWSSACCAPPPPPPARRTAAPGSAREPRFSPAPVLPVPWAARCRSSAGGGVPSGSNKRSLRHVPEAKLLVVLARRRRRPPGLRARARAKLHHLRRGQAGLGRARSRLLPEREGHLDQLQRRERLRPRLVRRGLSRPVRGGVHLLRLR